VYQQWIIFLFDRLKIIAVLLLPIHLKKISAHEMEFSAFPDHHRF